MNKLEIKKLDRLYQITLIKENPMSILGGKTQVIHHFIMRSNMSTRWWRPNGISLTHEQHSMVESLWSTCVAEKMISIKGKEWYKSLQQRANLIVKNLSYTRVLAYLKGEAEDYI